LLVARRVRDDEGARRGGEIAVADIDGDVLLEFRLEPVDQQRKVDRLTGGSELFRFQLGRPQLIVEHFLRLIEQAADQGRLAVVDRSAGEQMQDAVELMGGLRRRLGATDGSDSRH